MNLGLSKPTALLAALLLFNFAWADEMPRAEPEDVGLSSERLERFSAEMEKGVEAGTSRAQSRRSHATARSRSSNPTVCVIKKPGCRCRTMQFSPSLR